MKRKAKVTISSLSLIFLVSSLFGGIVQADENYYDSQKSSVLDAMLNSIDYYNSATGKFVTTLINENEETTVDYQVDIDAQTAYQSVKDTVTNKNRIILIIKSLYIIIVCAHMKELIPCFLLTNA